MTNETPNPLASKAGRIQIDEKAFEKVATGAGTAFHDERERDFARMVIAAYLQALPVVGDEDSGLTLSDEEKADWLTDNFHGQYELWIDPVAIYNQLHSNPAPIHGCERKLECLVEAMEYIDHTVKRVAEQDGSDREFAGAIHRVIEEALAAVRGCEQASAVGDGEMEERVARAIYKAYLIKSNFKPKDSIDDIVNAHWRIRVEEAKAAIAAIQKGTTHD